MAAADREAKIARLRKLFANMVAAEGYCRLGSAELMSTLTISLFARHCSLRGRVAEGAGPYTYTSVLGIAV